MSERGEPSEPSEAVVEACPTCGEAIAAGDVFCESCGAELDPVAAVAAGSAGPLPVAVPDDDDDATAEVELEVEGGPAAVCPSCGGDQFADGFCSTCGTKRPTWRDHFTEAPADDVAGVCDKGVGRNRNEDAMAMAVVGPRAVLVVCDGVTTAPESDRASLAGSRAARDLLAAAPDAPEGTAAAVAHWSEQLGAACAAANREAVAVARTLGDPPQPPSCTFVASVATDQDGTGVVTTAWCGDSRAYWLPDDDAPTQLTIDHSLGTEMIKAGRTREEAEAEPTSHTITRWLGADSIDPTPETSSFEPAGPGWLLVCSDGLWNHLSEAEELADFVRAAEDAGTAGPLGLADALVDRANAGGGQDNITAVLARIGGPRPYAAATPEGMD